MTRPYAAIRLLEHGPLCLAEFIEITGWSRSSCSQVLAYLCDRQDIKRIARGTYQILP